MKIAIIGSGFYGCSLAIILSKKNQVDVYEKEKDIFNYLDMEWVEPTDR